eukprot:2794978-Rhodomonas_salina.3
MSGTDIAPRALSLRGSSTVEFFSRASRKRAGRRTPYRPTRSLGDVRSLHAMSGTDIAYAAIRSFRLLVDERIVPAPYALAVRCPVLAMRVCASSLRARYAMSGPDIAYLAA